MDQWAGRHSNGNYPCWTEKKKILRCFKISGISTETNIHIIVFPKGEERRKGTENL